MIFNSIEFLVFFSILFLLYWLVFNVSARAQNILILVGSYVFYAWWDWRFLFLLIGSSIANYFIGIGIHEAKSDKGRRTLLSIGLIIGLAGLIYFKYFNFFVDSLGLAFSKLHIDLHLSTIKIILPLGISYYTFRTISYLLDIDKGKTKPTHDWITFFSYVSFFPCLMSGPIDRAKTLIPQLEKRRVFNYQQAVDGLSQILWGLFKKIVIADNCAVFTNQIFDNPGHLLLPGSTYVLGAFYFIIQLYADFSGYSDMALGFSRLLGIEVTKNFNFPFFAHNIAEFWKKWHISLTSWMTDYVYTPLSIKFRDYGNTGTIFAILINFVLIGLWHGSNWTFVLYGFIHGLYFIPLILRGKLNKKNKMSTTKLFPSFTELLKMSGTFALIMFTAVLVRANSITDTFQYYAHLLTPSLLSAPLLFSSKVMLMVVLFLLVEWLQRDKEHALQLQNLKYPIVRYGIYYVLGFMILRLGGTQQEFIYFKF
jgi:alginate O-acetyltransferase complex protein AlgI